MSLNLKRPKRGEDEDDLLEFQEQFLKNMNQQPSAKVIKEVDCSQFKKETAQEADVKMDCEYYFSEFVYSVKFTLYKKNQYLY